MWVAGVFMGQMPLIRYGKSIGDGQYSYPKSVNGNEAVAGFLWATAIVEKPRLKKGR
jgi:hypothetical protein